LAHCLDPHHGDNKTYIDQFVLTCTLSMFAIHLRIRHRNLTRATSNPVDPTANSKRHFLLSARVWPLSELLGSNFRSFLDDSNTVWPSGDFRHNLDIFLCRFIFVTSLQSFTDIVCYGSVLFSLILYYLCLCSIIFYMYSFDHFSCALGSISSVIGSISSALPLPVSRERHGKLVDNFSHESDFTSLQDPFTSRPYKTPFYFYYCVPRKIQRGILLKIMSEIPYLRP